MTAGQRYRERHPQKAKEQTRAAVQRWRERNPKKAKDELTAWRKRNKDKVRAYHQMKTYGLTPEQRKAMYLAQNGCCAICKEPVEYDRIQTDHDHMTGKIRRLLCNHCNQLVGFVEKNENLMYDVFTYLGW